MKAWKQTYLLPGLLLKKTRGAFGAETDNEAVAIPKNAIVFYLGISQKGKIKLVAKFLYLGKIFKYTPFGTAKDSVEQVEAWIKSNFHPIKEI